MQIADSKLRDEYHLAWEDADHPDGPWHHLKVLEFRGEERISKLFWFEIEVYHDMRGADVDVEDLVGTRAALKIFTRTEPAHRVIHGVITDATQLELAASTHVARYRIVMRPPSIRTAMMSKSLIYLEKPLREIIEKTLKRSSLGAALTPSSAARPLTASDDLKSYQAPTLTFAWALEDVTRIDDVTARPCCVQYDESDFDFVSRLLEEEGISYAMSFTRLASLGADARFPVSDTTELEEVRRGWLPADYRARARNDEVFQAAFYQEASLGMTFDPLAEGTPVTVTGVHPTRLDLSFAVPAPPRIEITLEGNTERVPPLLTGVMIEPDELRVSFVYCGRTKGLSRVFIPRIHPTIPLSARVEHGNPLHYEPPPIVDLPPLL